MTGSCRHYECSFCY